MSNTIQKYRDYVMTGFVKSVTALEPVKASGAVVTDISGRDYLDCYSGIAVVNAGHVNPDVAAAAKAQIDKYIHCGSYLYHLAPVADLAEKLAHLMPAGLTKTFFGNGGEFIFLACCENELATGTRQYPRRDHTECA